jgi:predicted transcriptional regulator
MSLSVHKNIAPKIIKSMGDNRSTLKSNDVDSKRRDSPNDVSNGNNDTLSPKITVLDIERENRLSKVISLFSKGLNQEEIAVELHVDQSTVSRDLQLIKQEARKQVEKYLREDILLEYLRYMAGSNEITRKLWEIVQNENTTTKEKTNNLSQLMQSYNSRLQTLSTGPESYMNIRKNLSEIDLQRLADSEPFLKAQVKQRKLFPKGLFNFK